MNSVGCVESESLHFILLCNIWFLYQVNILPVEKFKIKNVGEGIVAKAK